MKHNAPTPARRRATGAPLVLLSRQSSRAQRQAGYFHTLREICQQPGTWRQTAAAMVDRRTMLQTFFDRAARGRRPMVITGSGSSFYGAECLAAALQETSDAPVLAVAGGDLLTHGVPRFAARDCGVMISLARSGNSPESSAAIDFVLESQPDCRHLVITCNREGRLAQRYRDDPRVLVVVLDDETCDCSLVMTSSLTNMLVAGRFLGLLDAPDTYRAIVETLAVHADRILAHAADDIARTAESEFISSMFLGSGARFSAAREAALKMLEMSGGRIATFVESYLGLRHGPMCAIHDTTLVFCFLSSDSVVRAYEVDVIGEMNRKQLGRGKVIVGPDVPPDIAEAGDLVIDSGGPGRALADIDHPAIDILVGQLLAFFRCLHMGLKPDRPSTNGAIARVVESFDIHRRDRFPVDGSLAGDEAHPRRR